MPMTFPAHQGLILPVVRRWPNSFDALALSVGAAMPDITDSILSFPINGYFRQWYGHSLPGIFTLDLVGGLFLTWCIAAPVRRIFRARNTSQRWIESTTITPPILNPDDVENRETIPQTREKLRLWSFSVLVGVLSHVGFDLISHDTNLLLYPWHENVRLFPDWWYRIWIEIPALHRFGRPYFVGVFSLLWGMLSVVGSFLFLRFLRQEYEKRVSAE